MLREMLCAELRYREELLLLKVGVTRDRRAELRVPLELVPAACGILLARMRARLLRFRQLLLSDELLQHEQAIVVALWRVLAQLHPISHNHVQLRGELLEILTLYRNASKHWEGQLLERRATLLALTLHQCHWIVVV